MKIPASDWPPKGVKWYYADPQVCIAHGDCREIVPRLGKFDVLLTDPPYSKQTHDGALTNRSSGIQKLVDFDSVNVCQLRDMFGIIAEHIDKWFISFIDYRHIVEMENQPPNGLRSVRFGIWVKDNPMPQLSGDRPAQGFEAIMIHHKVGGRMKWNRGGYPAVWHSPISGDHFHPTSKPMKLINNLILDFTQEGETIFDPFMGSGTTLVAAKSLGRRAIGIEREEKYCAAAVNRLRQEYLSLSE